MKSAGKVLSYAFMILCGVSAKGAAGRRWPGCR
jgi:hypothetical protein